MVMLIMSLEQREIKFTEYTPFKSIKGLSDAFLENC